MRAHVFRHPARSRRLSDLCGREWRHGRIRPRSGLSLVELLVTIAMIAILASLLLPALGIARESARRTYCSNNLAQLTKGLISHDMEQSSLPGWRNSVAGYTEAKLAAGAPDLARVSWTVSILPFIGENDLADWYREFTSGAAVDDVTRKRVDLFVCPSADGVARSGLCYMGNGGTGAETLASGSPPQQYRGDGAMLDTVGNGYAAGRWSLDQMALGDGMAGTLLLVERCGLEAPRDVSWASFPMPTVSGNRNRFETNHVVLHPPALAGGQHPPEGARILNPTAETLPAASNDWAWRYPSSRHKGGVVAAFADGHVRFLGEKIAPWVYCQLLTSDKTYRSARAAGWEQYRLNGQWVPYILDDADISR
jgi:prepilin-type N-terminal cleavage/methylation domain-containing protein/prepilin-type processing-associated H-X9-DG protein